MAAVLYAQHSIMSISKQAWYFESDQIDTPRPRFWSMDGYLLDRLSVSVSVLVIIEPLPHGLAKDMLRGCRM